MLTYGIVALIIIIVDQITKLVAADTLTNISRVLIPKLINLVYMENTGAAFSLFSKHVYVLGILSVVFSIAIIVYAIIQKPTHPLHKLSVAMIFAGALGNGIDRIFRGYVIDFIEFDFINFPVFNVADISITIGAILFMVYVIFYDKN